MSYPARPFEERFEECIDRSPGRGPWKNCWLWTGYVRKDVGYGEISKCRADGGGIWYAHRLSYERYHGRIPNSLVVRHKCGNRLCQNPEHLELGTIQQNIKDRDLRGRTSKGELASWSKLTEERVHWIRALAAKGWTRSRIAKLFGIAPATATNVVKRKTWKHVCLACTNHA